MHRWIVRVEAIEQRVHLHAEELRMGEEFRRHLEIAGHARIRPDEAVEARHGLDDLRDISVVGMEDNTVVDLVLPHELVDPVAVDRNPEHRLERADVHVGVEDQVLATGAPDLESSPSAASRPAPISTLTPRSASVCPTAASPTTGCSDRADGPMWPIRTRLPAPCPPEIMTPYTSRQCARTWTSVSGSGTAIAVTHAALISSLRGQSSRPIARTPARHAAAERSWRSIDASRPSASSSSQAASTPWTSDTDGVNGNLSPSIHCSFQSSIER